MTRKRESNFELLRILACLMVIGHHFIVKGNGVVPQAGFSLPQIVYMLLLPGGKIGVNCFVLLTGYFLSRKGADAQRVCKLVWTVTLYSLFSNILASVLGMGVPAGSWKAAILPIAYNTVGWFVAPFLAITILSQFFNILLQNLKHADWLRLLASLTGICILCTNLLPHATFFVDQFVWFLYLYVIGAYLRRFPARWMQKRGLVAGLTAAAFAAMFLVQAAIRVLVQGKPEKLPLADYYATNSNSLFCLAAAVLLFLLCRNLKIRSNAVNWVAGSCFGVYLLTDCTVLGTLLWSQVSKLALYTRGTGAFLLGAAASIAALFGICFVIAKILYYVLERPLFGLWRKLGQLWEGFLLWIIRKVPDREGED